MIMLINVRVVPRSSREKIVEEEGRLKVYVHAPADEGRANKALIELLAGYFGKAKSALSIVKGAASRNKVVKVDD